MSKIKRIIAVMLSVVMIVCMFCLDAGAAVNIYSSASTIKSGKTYTATLKRIGDEADYKITANAAGELKITLDVDLNYFDFFVFSSDGKEIKTSSRSIKSGRKDDNYKIFEGRFKGTLTYEIEEGTYYIRVHRSDSDSIYVNGYGWSKVTGSGKVSLKASFPSGEIKAIVIPMKVKSTLQLGAITTNAEDEVKWESSDKSVATVNSKGKVTAKKKGTATITATLGITKQYIVIKVS